MSFEDIPEDRYESYPCICGGSVEQNTVSGSWECAFCGFKHEAEDDEEQQPEDKT